MLLALLAALGASFVAPQERAFVHVDAERVSASLKEVEPVLAREPGCLATIEVRRPAGFDGSVQALRLRVTPRGRGAEPIEVERFEPPRFGRAGRGASGRPDSFPVLLPLEAKALKGARVEVLELSAWTGAAPDSEPPVEVGRPQVSSGFDSDYQRTLPRTTIPLRNLTDREVEVVLAADFIDPHKARSLVRGRVPAGGESELVVRMLPTGAGEYLGAEIRRVELVDWSSVESAGADEAQRLFAEAWDGLHRLPEELFPLGARFTWEHRSAQTRSRRTGALRLAADGTVTVELDGEHEAAGLRSTTADLERALVWVARPRAEALGARFTLMRGGPRPVVRVEPNPLPHGLKGALSFVLADGRIAGYAGDALGEGLATECHWHEEAPARLLSLRQDQATIAPPPTSTLRLDWSRASGAWLPLRATQTVAGWNNPALEHETRVAFTGWTPRAAALAELPPPTGPLADELRAAWDAFYRYPDPEARIAGAFRVRTPGGDGVWIGRKQVEGELELAGMQGGFWRESAARIGGGKLTEEEQAALENAVLDRVLMWSSRDLCRQPRFDQAFAGATLERDGDWILAPGAFVPGVRLQAGRVAALRTLYGTEVELRWETVAGQLVPVERRSGDEAVEVEWQALDGGWLLPERVEFVAVFGKGWGPETLELSELAPGR